ncbi:pyrroloquinoline quinone biosynthesis protein PqqE [Oleisolibacter albus]|uniref:pyrroloquinoline quinone biosynthesis protein PqqE n=1 Tax=Oleisolibacter albus TaxID=2171757 RepID=UPI000DF3420D|nr:pyrroloquinoline quinone biosynthesis protein PqqE [Oleisolibacter albus]
MTAPAPPLALLAELTHRCPLACPYCSNPVEMVRAAGELPTDAWMRVMTEAAALGCLQVHFSGGEPTVRKDLEGLVAHAAALGLYSNLITSGVLVDAGRLAALAAAGLDHVQVSIQDTETSSAEIIGGLKGAQAKKLAFCRAVRAAGLPLTLNAVVHRRNLDRLGEMIALALDLDAARLEVAHVQYYGWALKNRAALMPTRGQLDTATRLVEAARAELKGRLVIDYVIPDYYASRPKPCMGGWGRRFITVNPAGKVLPCHAAESIPGLGFDRVTDRPLAEIWETGAAFERYRGTGWMPPLCQGCEHKQRDWGGCRCQALALAGDAGATDPACNRSPHHAALVALAGREAAADDAAFTYRRFS